MKSSRLRTQPEGKINAHMAFAHSQVGQYRGHHLIAMAYMSHAQVEEKYTTFNIIQSSIYLIGVVKTVIHKSGY